MKKKEKMKYIALSILCFILGIIGLALPVMPGLIFIGIGIWFLSKGSERVMRRIGGTRLYEFCDAKIHYFSEKFAIKGLV